jgi:S1-C subfamily serine protease
MGYEGNQPLSVRTGVLSSVEPSRLVLTLSAGPGMSGSPILDSKGDVIGVLNAGEMDAAVVYAIPIRALRSWLTDTGIPLVSG